MAQKVPSASERSKDNDWPKSVPPPGPELEQRILDCWQSGRDCQVWHAGSAIAPRTSHAYFDPYDFEKPRAAMFLEKKMQTALDRLQPHDWAMLRHLGAAVRYDLYGIGWDELARGYWVAGDTRPGKSGDPEGAARREVRLGRKVWVTLDAWPWAWWPPKGRPPDGWRKHGADPRLAAAFEAWARGAPFVLPE
jgi:hypothetical protein